MRKKHVGRHLDTGEIDALAIRQLREQEFKRERETTPEEAFPITDGSMAQYIVFGQPGQEPQVAVHQVAADDVHTNQELTGSIAGVSLSVHGDGSTGLQVCGYHLDEARAQWDIAAATIGGFKINPFPAPAEGQVICVYCGGLLHEDTTVAAAEYVGTGWLHTDDSQYCVNSTGSVAYPVRLVARGSQPHVPLIRLGLEEGPRG